MLNTSMETEVKEYTKAEAQTYLANNGKTDGVFYYNVYGWGVYYTLEPTFATPTGKLKEFPRRVRIYLPGHGPVDSNDITPIKEKGSK